MEINFFSEDVKEVRIPKRKIRTWVNQCIISYNFTTGNINYIFCSDEYILKVNKKYLNHDEYTDIITFNYNEEKLINGDIYVCLNRVRENASNFDVTFHNELQRVIIHGILHLVGLNDSTKKEIEIMRHAEEKSIALYNKIWK